jgi:hypothetical protein
MRAKGNNKYRSQSKFYGLVKCAHFAYPCDDRKGMLDTPWRSFEFSIMKALPVTAKFRERNGAVML